MTNLKQTPLYGEHTALKGRMVPFAGYEMPVMYSGVIEEHLAVRGAAGLFDVSHMGEFLVSGSDARDFLQRMTTNDITKMHDGRCQYSLLCYDNGTVVDDIIVSQITFDRFLIVVNASNIDKDFMWLDSHRPDGVELKNLSDGLSLIALQGPKSPLIMKTVFGSDFSDLKYYHFTLVSGSFEMFLSSGQFAADEILVSRTGYTGEDGFEIMLPNTRAVQMWRDLIKAGEALGLKPAGLGARDTLRLEVCYPLYGHELSDTICPLEAGLGWVIKLGKPDFIGKNALEKIKIDGLPRQLVAIDMLEPGIPREGYPVLDEVGHKIGSVTSGTHSPNLRKPVGLALVASKFATKGQKIFLDIRGRTKQAVVVEKPFYKR